MCFIEWGSLVGDCFLWQQIAVFGERESLVRSCTFTDRKFSFSKMENFQRECENSIFLHTKIFWITQKNIGSHPFRVAPRRSFALNFLYNPHHFSLFTATKITCSFPFHRPLAASSTHCNIDFSQNPILRLMKSLPFPPVQNMAVRICGTNKFLQKILMR